MNTPKQISILNALITYAAENIPGGLSAEEQEVAKIVGRMAAGEQRGYRTHVYKVVNSTGHGGGMSDAIYFWAGMGWRVVAIVSDTRSGYAHSMVLERPVGVSHPDD
jgi:hypothetical protein